MKLPIYTLPFAPPMSGFEGEFNTFRMSRGWAQRLNRGDKVLLFDAKQSIVFGEAKVLRVITGRLGELAVEHAAMNHNRKGEPVEGAPERLIASMQRRYGPRIAEPGRWATVIYVRRLK